MQPANYMMNDTTNIRNGSGEIRPVGCQIFSGHEEHYRSAVEHSLQQSRSKKYSDDTLVHNYTIIINAVHSNTITVV